jgi:uncharacterized repeat protein (TIGR03803 family)
MPNFGRLACATLVTVAVSGAARAGTIKTLYNLDATSGTGNFGLFAVDSENIGGTASYGTVFKLNPGSKSLTVLYNFTGGADGAGPASGLALGPDDVAYGVTSEGGTKGAGTVFKIKLRTGKETTLHQFTGLPDTGHPRIAPILGPDGKLYGVTSGGGPDGLGEIYRVDPATHDESAVFTFNGTNGSDPGGITFGPDGLLYGTATQGGPVGYGLLFQVDPSTGQETILYNFAESGPNAPQANVVFDSAGVLYGQALTGGGGQTVIYRFDPTTAAFTSLDTLTYGPANTPTGTILLGTDDNLYGTVFSFDTHEGIVYQVNASTGAEKDVYTFNGRKNGGRPYGITFGKNNLLYGATMVGGSTRLNNHHPGTGTIYSLVP